MMELCLVMNGVAPGSDKAYLHGVHICTYWFFHINIIYIHICYILYMYYNHTIYIYIYIYIYIVLYNLSERE